MNVQTTNSRMRFDPLVLALAAGMALLAPIPAAAASPAINWSKVQEHKLVLFYPGQASWEWVLTPSDHSGAPKFRAGKDCRNCHLGEESDIGKTIVSGKKLEPNPIPGKPGSLALRVKVARDDERLYFRLQWKPGPAPAKKMDPDVAARVTVMLDDGSVREATRAGCWSVCHDDAIGMASAPQGGKIQKYLGSSRVKLTRHGGGTDLKPAATLDQMMAKGDYLEYWQAQLNPGKPAKAIGGYILDKRHQDDKAPVRAEAEFSSGEWTVTLSRPLKAAGRGEKTLQAGKTYMVAFAIHDAFTDHRYHYVSLDRMLTIDGGKADFVAGKQ